MFRDQPFPSACERALVQSTAAAVGDFADPKDGGPGATEHPLQGGAPRGERPVAQVCATVAQQVECDISDRMKGTVLSLRQMNASLEFLKPGRIALRVQRDDLAVQDDRCF